MHFGDKNIVFLRTDNCIIFKKKKNQNETNRFLHRKSALKNVLSVCDRIHFVIRTNSFLDENIQYFFIHSEKKATERVEHF